MRITLLTAGTDGVTFRIRLFITPDFRGTLQGDSYEASACFARRRGGKILLAGCLAHVRRKFHEAAETAPKVAGWFLRHCQNLSALEARLRHARAGPKLRAAERASLSRPCWRGCTVP